MQPLPMFASRSPGDALLLLAAEQGEHAEGAEVHDRVDGEVEERGGAAVAAAGHHRDQQVAGMGDA